MNPHSLSLKQIVTDADVASLQSLLESAPRYFQNVSGKFAPPTAGKETVESLPPNCAYEDKFLFGVYLGKEMVGCVDLIRGYPDRKTAMIGLLLISEKHQGAGLGEETYRKVEQIVQKWAGIETIRISVVESNSEVFGFWKRMGFIDSGIRRPYHHGKVNTQKEVWEKKIDRKLGFTKLMRSLIPSDSAHTLKTARLILEPITRQHTQELVTLFSDPELHRYVPFEAPTLEQQLERCQRWEKRISPDETEVWLNWASRLTQSGKVIGHFQAGIKADQIASIGYVVSAEYQNQGIGTEALQSVFDFLRDQMRVIEIKAWSDTRNLASHRLAQKMGMTQVELIKDADSFKGSTSDEFVFSKVMKSSI
jgi:RimJ/RimL family protein N-acetyltransferase